MSGFLDSLLPEISAEWSARSRARIYQTDPEAWVSDVLGRRWYSKQHVMGEKFMANERLAIKSANGCGKSYWLAEMVGWWSSVWPREEALAIISAPTADQIDRVVFKYLKDNYGYAAAAGLGLPGRITDSREWVYNDELGQKQYLAFGKRPKDTDIVSSFQGTRKLRTLVALDEGGGIPADLFTAAEAVATGSESRIVTIGNPDKLGTEFHKIFTDNALKADWAHETISAFDLPSLTGEMVYPGDPVKQAELIKGLTSPKWVEHKKRAWGENSARYKSKVLGEFPDTDDFSFFAQSDIDNARETIILPDSEMPIVLGVDLAAKGDDESALYRADYGNNEENESVIGARIRKVQMWSKAATTESSTRTHDWAIKLGARDVVLDATGLGEGIFDTVLARAGDQYNVLGAKGAWASSDPTRWLNARAEWYDRLREGMRLGKVDIDPEDKELIDEFLVIQYGFTPKGQIFIESKKDMKKRGVDSPDRLDAVVYSYVNAFEMLPGAEEGIEKGDVIVVDPWAEFGLEIAGMVV